MAGGYSLEIRNARMEAVRTRLLNGRIKIYSGTRPATGAAITTQVHLATFDLNGKTITVANGELTIDLSTPIASTGIAAGTASWARGEKQDGSFAVDWDAGATGSGKDLEISSTTIQPSSPVSLESAVIPEGNP